MEPGGSTLMPDEGVARATPRVAVTEAPITEPHGRVTGRRRLSGPVSSRRRRLRALTSLRFVAALGVFVHHATPNGAHGSGLASILWEGTSGVTFFFLLSGFVLAYSYAGRLGGHAREGIRAFYVSRIARIYPLFLLTLLIAAAPTLLERIRLGPAGLAPLGLQLTLTQAFVPLSDPISHRVIALGFDAPAWSLWCEAFFYALFPVCLVALYRVRRPRLLIGLACVFSLWPMLLAASFHGAGATYWFLYLFPPARLADFLIGMCLGLVLLAIDGRALSRIRYWSMLEALTLVALAATVAMAGRVPTVYRFDVHYVPAMAAVIFVFALERGRLSRLLGHSTIMFFGEISFAFYMLHALVMRAAGYPPGGPGGLAHAGPLALILVGTLVLSAMVHLGYELPAQRRVKRWGEKRLP